MGTDVTVYDYCAIILLFITVFYYYRSRVHRSYRGIILAVIVAVTAAASVCDALRIEFAGMDTVSDMQFLNVTILNYLFLAFIPPLYLLYVIADTDTWHIIREYKFRIVLCVLPIAVITALLITTYYVPVVFEVGEGKELIKHWGYNLGNGIFALYLAITWFFLKTSVAPINFKRFQVLLTPIGIVMVAIVIIGFAPAHHLISFTVTICILLLVLINRRVEDSTDYVTGMHTYKIFAEDMGFCFASGKKMEIILLNIVNYKYALRMAGYDVLLKLMGPVSDEIFKVMRKYRSRFMCYYIGDGKFAIELSGRHFSLASEIADEISRSIRQNIRMEVSDLELEINTCLVSCPDDISDTDSLFMLISDLDMVESGGRVVSASTITTTKEFTMKREMSTIIDRALANHYFSVFYQPIYDTKEKRFASAEALVRLRDPKFGYISPALFIPLAEKNGAIHAIGYFVLEEVIKFIASPDFEHLGVDYIEINLSAMQCLRSDLADEIISLCTKYDVDPQKINLEITETASIYSQSKFYGNISVLADHGFTFSLDDFGTGYSNLMRITSLPLQIVKLDRTFVLMEESGGHHVIIKNLIEMFKNMKLKVVVEGVETEDMAASFIQMGVDEIQGFFYSRPLTKSAYIRFIKEKMPA